MTCIAADKGKPQTENLIATLEPTAKDMIDYKPGIHEDIYLRLTVEPESSTNLQSSSFNLQPIVRFAYSLNNKKWIECGDAFRMKEGKWIGAKFGFVAAETDPKADRGWIDADWIRITP